MRIRMIRILLVIEPLKRRIRHRGLEACRRYARALVWLFGTGHALVLLTTKRT